MERAGSAVMVVLVAVLGLMCGLLVYSVGDRALKTGVDALNQSIQADDAYLEALDDYLTQQNELDAALGDLFEQVNRDSDRILDGDWIMHFTQVNEEMVATYRGMAALDPPPRYEDFHQSLVVELEKCIEAEDNLTRAVQFLDGDAFDQNIQALDSCIDELNAILDAQQ